METLRKHIISIASVIVAMTTIITSVYAFDGRYLKVSDFNQYQVQSEVRRLEDEIFVLEFKVQNGTATALDRAMLERLKSRLESLRRQQ